jgi:hypothetical protein
LAESQHDLALDYLSIQLSVRDREQLSKIICYQQPDLVTQSVRDVVAAYDPILRKVHASVDLSTSLLDFEEFMTDFTKLSRNLNISGWKTPTNGDSADKPRPSAPSIIDFVKLIKKHIPASHRFLHQVAKNCPEVTLKYKEYIQSAAAHFRPNPDAINPDQQMESPTQPHSNAGSLTSQLQKLYSELPVESRQSVADALDNQSAYLFALYCASRDRMRSALDDDTSAPTGPGIYLAKWQQLLDSTPITPASMEGPVRTGKDSSVKEKGGVGVEQATKQQASLGGFLDSGDIPDPPDVGVVAKLLGPKFHEVIVEIGKKQWTSSLN